MENSFIGTWLTDKDIVINITGLITMGDNKYWEGKDESGYHYAFDKLGNSINGGKLIHKKRGDEDLRKRWAK